MKEATLSLANTKARSAKAESSSATQPAAKSARRTSNKVTDINSRAEVQPSREERIATAAYYRALARGFEQGYELEDWVAAEAEHSNS